mgnify:CR=1 FL=1
MTNELAPANQPSPHVPNAPLMPDDAYDADPTKEMLQVALAAREDSLLRRVDGIKAEARQLPAVVRARVYANPVVSVGGSLLAGALTGLLLGGIGKGKKKKTAAEHHRALTTSYVEAIARDARVRVGKGEDVAEAIRKTLGKRTPLVIVEAENGSPPGVLASTFDILLKTAVGFGAKILIDRAIIAAGLTELVPSVDEDDGDEGSGVAPIAAAVSES